MVATSAFLGFIWLNWGDDLKNNQALGQNRVVRRPASRMKSGRALPWDWLEAKLSQAVLCVFAVVRSELQHAQIPHLHSTIKLHYLEPF
jgi:hypothetical protein